MVDGGMYRRVCWGRGGNAQLEIHRNKRIVFILGRLMRCRPKGFVRKVIVDKISTPKRHNRNWIPFLINTNPAPPSFGALIGRPGRALSVGCPPTGSRFGPSILPPNSRIPHWSQTAASYRSPTYRALRARWLSETLLRRGKPASHIPMAQGPISRQQKADPIGLHTRQSNS